ncbi:MAG: bifunctional UDP-N-acetylmuramoyl-tripeptide:D-alanyl-D-alanine ligase/alanine racemase [Prevotellaceae bacterium]|jgi:alanine racemase|nr:bifunctional UDP-N-acetylmuramoyl-tripeptide:D-alanyl-D-alanine ligase/alanine racemase [Prevotellaceae bacterium]
MTNTAIATIIGAKNKINNPLAISWLLTDSRSLAFPAETMFFAIKTPRNDGHNFVRELYENGVRCFVVSELRDEFAAMNDADFLLVDNTLQALQQLAEYQRGKFNIPIVGITGSNGKTIVKEWLYQLLHSDLRITRSPRSYNSQIGVPLSLWMLNEQTELGIFEAGISQPNEMAHLQSIIRPTIGIFTNLGDAHQEGFASLEQKGNEKLKLFENAEVLIYNSDNRIIADCIRKNNLKTKLFSWGSDENDVLRVISIQQENVFSLILLKYNDLEFELKIPFADDASVENALHCVAVMLYLGYQTDEIARRLWLLEPVAMRLEIKKGLHNCLIINDSYNSDLQSLRIALDFLNTQATLKKLARVVVLSDILQSGKPDETLYQIVADLLEVKGVEHFIGIGKEISENEHCFSNIDSYFFENVSDFLHSSVIQQFTDSIVLLKGSRIFRFEEISERLEAVAHETVLEVNLNALADNLNYFRAKLRPETRIICMVKAFAYGSGAVEVARTLQHHRADYLAVAVADEGAELRSEGIRLPIMVMNPEQHSFNEIFDNALEPEIYNFALLDGFVAAAERLGLTDYPIHLKIDSGMHRLGFELQDIPALIAKIKSQNQLKVRSVFSHLAGADDARFDDFTRLQISTFTQIADMIAAEFQHRILRHILNSAGIERFPEFQLDMVRLGIGHYGISALKEVKINTVCSLKTIVLQTKNVQAGETVGYSRRGVITKDTRIAVLPVGYADGLDRRLGNGVGEVWINGHRAKTVGNICMDLCMVDITDIAVNEGDAVEIFGDNITISEIAEKIGTIPYEILTSISRRVKRVYFQE